jgi:hypothetical protein
LKLPFVGGRTPFVSLRSIASTAALLLAFAVPAAAADQPLPSLTVPDLTAAPSMDGTIGASWSTAATAALTTDFTNRRAADEPTAVRIAQDAGAIDVAFDVTQREAIVAATTTNGSSVTSDDYVEVALSPNGPLGFQYAFYANPRGARYQTSSENSAYAPPWSAAVATRAGGYTVTMRIPLSIIRSGGRTTWRAQFVRATVHANSLDVWAFSERASNVNDATFFGTIDGVGAKASDASKRPRPRAQIYGLGERTTPANGGDTSRVGGDVSLPVTPTASLVGSFHPDYSNVETDQQTIAPTAFPRSYTEVRPFFTQVGQSFNSTFACTNCPQMLYTPVIPTYRDAYALEGTQGPLTFAAFDAAGYGRSDSAETLNFSVSNPVRAIALDVQNVTVNLDGGVRDQVTSLASGYLDPHLHLGAYFNYATESGTTITDASQASYYQAGFLYATATTTALLAWQHLGAQFAPFDAYVAQNDVNGPQLYASRTIPFKPNTVVHDVVVSTYDATFNNHAGVTSQNDLSTQVNLDLRDLVTIHGYYSESAVRTYANELLPFDGSGALLGYKYSTATPSYVEYTGGPYYHGSLDAWTYLTTLPLSPKIKLSLETDRSSYYTTYPGESSGTQWLERATLDFQINREAEFDVGPRRIFGPSLPVAYAPPNFTPIVGGNFSAAFHYLSRSGRDEFYLVYGNPNNLSTLPALYAKVILYLGAPKGT